MKIKSTYLKAVENHKRKTLKNVREYKTLPRELRKVMRDLDGNEIDQLKIIDEKVKQLEEMELNEETVLDIRDLLKYIDSFILIKKLN